MLGTSETAATGPSVRDTAAAKACASDAAASNDCLRSGASAAVQSRRAYRTPEDCEPRIEEMAPTMLWLSAFTWLTSTSTLTDAKGPYRVLVSKTTLSGFTPSACTAARIASRSRCARLTVGKGPVGVICSSTTMNAWSAGTVADALRVT